MERTNWVGSFSPKWAGSCKPAGMKLNSGTIVDATLIAAPNSTKKGQKARDSEIHQTRKGEQWCSEATAGKKAKASRAVIRCTS
jgi:hypothetical protein